MIRKANHNPSSLPKKILIAGAGLTGAVIARSLAEEGLRVTVLEEKAHAGGHCRTYRDGKTGVMVHQYGPHIFHTDLEEVWGYVNRFAAFMPYVNRVKAHTHRGTYSLPVNLLTLSQFFGREFTPRQARDFIAARAEKIREPRNFEEKALSMMGEELYRAFFYGYTVKQWGKEPRELPASLLTRLPFRFNYEDNYFSHPHQGIPAEGYSAMIENILDHPGVEVALNRPYAPEDAKGYDHLFYSGRIDRFFDYRYGRLEYRTLDFEKFYPSPDETLDGDYQGGAVVNDCRPDVPYTRVTEHKHFAPWESLRGTVCCREYSRACGPGDAPYYPVRLSGNEELVEKYEKEAEKLSDVTFVGRLGRLRYMDMDRTVAAAMEAARGFLVSLS